jgi:hypothetical protein
MDNVGHRPGGLVKNAVHVRLRERLGRRLDHRGFLIGPFSGLLLCGTIDEHRLSRTVCQPAEDAA